MKIHSIVNRYIFGQLLPPFCLSVMFFTIVFLMANILDIMDKVMNYRVKATHVLLLLLYEIPGLLQFVVPMAVMMAVLLTFMRMSADNEVIALKAGGVSPASFFLPVAVFCLIATGITAFLGIYASPRCWMASKQLLFEIVTRGVNLGLKERTFNDCFSDVTLYFGKVNPDTMELWDILVDDRRNPKMAITIMAPEGRLHAEPEQLSYHLILKNGTISQVEMDRRSVNTIDFALNHMRLDTAEAVEHSRRKIKGRKGMNMAELYAYRKQANKAEDRYLSNVTEFHKRIAIPFACLSLGFLALPLGLQTRSSRKTSGIGLGLGCFLIYYVLLSGGMAMAESGAMAPFFGTWLPNSVMALIGMYLLRQVLRERGVSLKMRVAPRKRSDS